MQFSFLHRTFLEYLTACTLARQGWQAIATFVDKKAWLPEWQEVVVLLAGKLTDPAPLLNMLSNPKPTPTNPHGDDYFHHRLALAALCLTEIHPAHQTPNSELSIQHSELFDSITTTAFTFWWQRQMNGTIAVIPSMTRALPALGQVNGTLLLAQLARLLADPQEDVREAAAEAVGGLMAQRVRIFKASKLSRKKWEGRSVEELSR